MSRQTVFLRGKCGVMHPQLSKQVEYGDDNDNVRKYSTDMNRYIYAQ